MLPNKDYVPGIVHDESLRNLSTRSTGRRIVDYVGLPCVLKDAHGGGWQRRLRLPLAEELIQHYDDSGLLTMIVQEFIKWDQYVRCLCLGQEDVLPMQYDPSERKYLVDARATCRRSSATRIVDDSLKLVRALGYDMNSSSGPCATACRTRSTS